MQDKIINTMVNYYECVVAQHKLNIDIMLANPRAIPEHENFTEAIDKELSSLVDAKDKLEALKQYF